MNGRFVVQEGHFHIESSSRYVLIGWFDGEDRDFQAGKDCFEVYLDNQRLDTHVVCLEDESVRQKYAKYDLKVSKEYVISAKLPKDFARFHKLHARLADGRLFFERGVPQLLRLRGQLNYRITNVQSTGASCVISGWAASKKPIKINVFDRMDVPVKCEVSHFPKPDVALEYRETDGLYDSGFSVTVPVNGRKKMILQITDGERSVMHQFRPVDKNRVILYVKKAQYYMKRNGIKKTCKRAVNELYELVGDTGNYTKWRQKNMPSEAQLASQRQKMQESQHRGSTVPLVYVVTPYKDFHYFTAAAVSMKNQTYTNWKWIIVCAQAELQKAKERLHGIISENKIIFLESAGQQSSQHKIAQAFSWIGGRHAFDCTAAEGPDAGTKELSEQDLHAKKIWTVLLAPSDTLEPDALYSCLELIRHCPKADMCYTDEDQLSEDGKLYSKPVFKSDFNIDMLRAMNYLGHMVLLRADLVSKIGAWNAAYANEASYDYYLRAAEAASLVVHLQRVVYHQRETGRQPHGAGQVILNAHYKRQGIPAYASPSQTPGIYHTTYQWDETPMVSVNIPNKDHIDDLDTCVQSVLKKCTYPNYEIVIIENNSAEESTFAYYKKLQEQDQRVRVVYWKEEFNYSKITNFGVAQSKGSYILLLNNDTEVITPDFMEEMLGYCMREDVGICGARLFYFDDTIQHAGVIVGLGGICGEGFQGFPKENGGYQNRIFCPQDYSAVTAACLMTKKSVFEEVGGMDGNLQIAYNDIDYCLKVRDTGRLVVYNPFAMLHHYEYKSRGVENTAEKLARYNKEVDLFTARWADLISAGDPYYNPNLTRRYQDFSLRRIELLK